jgi:hypothetical protein
MAFVRTKKVKGKEYYQLVESRRVDGKPRQKVLVHLGRHPSVDDALREWSEAISRLQGYASEERRSASAQPESSRAHHDAVRRAENAERRADELKTNLQKLRDLRAQGVA